MELAEIVSSGLSGLIPGGIEQKELLMILLYIFVAGFLSLIMFFVLYKKNKTWEKLDIYTKLAISFIVGICAYLLWVFSSLFWYITRYALTNQEMNAQHWKVDYVGLTFMIFSAFSTLFIIHHFNRKKNKMDELTILRNMSLSFNLCIILYGVSVGFLLLKATQILIQYTNLSHFFIALVVFASLFVIYSSYSLFARLVYNLTNKKYKFPAVLPIIYKK